ncbi:MAG: initiation control protein YabA [Halanaerobiales bacterium]|jgi:regulator of replication initiation timing|nr:initiation control protein YabA [Halanaerobiales bacterium]
MDQEILSTLAHFQEQIEALSLRFHKLKDITYQLYQENEELQRENEELKNLLFEDQADDSLHKKEGYSNLIDIYDEGYHVCPLSFGEKRKGDCLFCLNLLENQGKEK